MAEDINQNNSYNTSYIQKDPVQVTNITPYDDGIETLAKIRLNLLKECLEMTGVDFGRTNNKIEYRNYLINNPPMALGGVGGECGGFGGMFMGSLGEGIDIASANIISFMLGNEGWCDARCKNGWGSPFNGDGSAVAHQSDIDRNGVITVGPGLTNYLNGNSWMTKKITKGTLFSFNEICYIYAHVIASHANIIKRKYPHILKMGQNCIDACIDLAHSGEKFLSGLSSCQNPQDVARCMLNGPTSAKGQQLRGLVERRMAEAAIALGNTTVNNAGAQQKLNNYYTLSATANKVIPVMKSFR